MPATFRHAILATRRLGYRMLWIDSLCIIQRSREDWVLESCRMQHYYKHAVLTLAADRAKGDEDGFLGPRSNSSDKIIAVRFQMPTAEVNVYLRDEIELEKTPSPVPGTLGSRAWALQEDLLSPRTLHFTEEQLIWECQFHKLHESVASSGSEDLLLQTSRVDNITKRFFLKPHSRHLHPVWSKSELDWSKRWYNIVDNFTRRDITYHPDRLPAISAVAREIHEQCGWTYIAGLWREDFRRGLLWSDFAENTHASAPSWSWASLEYNSNTGYHGGVYQPWPMFDKSVLPDDQIDLIDWNIDLKDRDPYGGVKSGRLVLRGRWMPASKWKGPTFHFNPQRWTEGKSHSDAALEHPPHDQIVCTLSTTSSTIELLRKGRLSYIDSNYFSFLQISSWDLTKQLWPNAALRGRQFRKIHGIEEEGSDEDRNYIITFCLVLVAAEEPGTFRRLGLCEVPRVNGLADNWEIEEITVV